MSNYGRPLPTHLRNQSLGGAQQQSPILLARIEEKKAELASLKDLQALSGGLADQMQMLADKLMTLSDGTEGISILYRHPVAAVLSNWHNVLRAINMASTKLPKPKDEEDAEKRSEDGPPLPQTLVRIPTQHAPAVMEQANAATAED
ncbi:dash complex subunit dad2 protein [Pyrenophora tritici-repentis]|uniref:DASH complex subunit DAD2 n=1 Tax=Pyrenophora tritici-repentis TaxID=45151 RepID=A0A922SXT0_9PLEO|nr:dash complex subunit dad2 protein [Pyrenophora tritici-repentis]KAI0625049.1 dash complex subunit dad2 protein [Pyrenophora tritici-repentis]KAI1510673.1 DASH complex protein [Pyrenophora tritici-repentis]KAI1681388.1 DASH complex protein [Pyrenophora tritici-repentis]